MRKNLFTATILAITTLGVLITILAFTVSINYNKGTFNTRETTSVETSEEKLDNKGNELDNSINITNIEYAKCNNNYNEQLIEHIGYTVSYNNQWNLPNWVAYELTAEEVQGTEERSDKFTADPCITSDAVISSDYTRSGYDRGHMAPAGDMKWSKQAMEESFYMTNICPQIHNVNAGDWKELEEFARDLAMYYNSIYICCGPIVTNNDTLTIGNERKIRVPSEFYKAFLRKKDDDTWTSIGFIIPNKAGNKPLLTYIVPVDSIEEKTGINLFFNLPDSIESIIEAEYNEIDWSLKR